MPDEIGCTVLVVMHADLRHGARLVRCNIQYRAASRVRARGPAAALLASDARTSATTTCPGPTGGPPALAGRPRRGSILRPGGDPVNGSRCSVLPQSERDGGSSSSHAGKIPNATANPTLVPALIDIPRRNSTSAKTACCVSFGRATARRSHARIRRSTQAGFRSRASRRSFGELVLRVDVAGDQE